MASPSFRNQGLSRLLMGKIMEKWGDSCDLLYLFANNSVRGFYPKFGFSAVDEYQCSKSIARTCGGMTAQKADMGDALVRQRLVQKIDSAKAIADIHMQGFSGLVMFYCTSSLRDNVFYLPQHNAFAVAENNCGTLSLYGLFCERDIPLDEVAAALSTNADTKLELGFTPRNKSGFAQTLLREEDTTLFVMGKDARLWQENRMMFPILSRA
jgi:hypothetical protein